MRYQRPKMLTVLVATSALVLGACGGDDGDSASGDSDGGGDGEVLKVGTKYDQPLFGVNTPDGVEGFDADIARYIGDQLGREVEFQEAVSANRETFLENGTVDMVVATYTINDERDEVIDFAGPYYVAGQDIMVRASRISTHPTSRPARRRVRRRSRTSTRWHPTLTCPPSIRTRSAPMRWARAGWTR